MSESGSVNHSRDRQAQMDRHERILVLDPSQLLSQGDSSGEIDFQELGREIYRNRLTIVAVVALLALASGLYAGFASKWYRAEVLLAPVEDSMSASVGASLGGLATLAGINVGHSASYKAVAVLESRDFAREFIEENGLLYVFFSDQWDRVNQKWLIEDSKEHPDLRDATSYFHEKVLRTAQERASGLVTLAIEWTDANEAAEWANSLAVLLNSRLREQAISDANANIDFLRSELEKTDIPSLQLAMGRLLENEMQKLMLARGNTEFAFRVIDSAQIPKEHVRPNRVFVVGASILMGAIVGTGLVVLAFLFRNWTTASREGR